MVAELAIADMVLIYGPLGLWVASLLLERYVFNNKYIDVIEKHTVAVNGLHVMLSKINGRLK